MRTEVCARIGGRNVVGCDDLRAIKSGDAGAAVRSAVTLNN